MTRVSVLLRDRVGHYFPYQHTTREHLPEMNQIMVIPCEGYELTYEVTAIHQLPGETLVFAQGLMVVGLPTREVTA